MGIFNDYGIDPDEIKEQGGFDIEDGTYRFEITDAEILDGTENKPDTTFFIIDYALEDEDGDIAGSTRSWYTMAEDGESDTKRVTQSLGFLKTDLKALGITNLAGFDGSEIVGLTGTLQLKSTPGKGANRDKVYQNIRSLRLDEKAEQAPEKAPARSTTRAKSTAQADAEAKARVKAKQAARAKAEEPVYEDDENPFG